MKFAPARISYRRFKWYTNSLIFQVVARLAIFNDSPLAAFVPLQLFSHRHCQLLIGDSGAAGCIPHQHDDIGELANVIRCFSGLAGLFSQVFQWANRANVAELAIRPFRVRLPDKAEGIPH